MSDRCFKFKVFSYTTDIVGQLFFPGQEGNKRADGLSHFYVQRGDGSTYNYQCWELSYAEEISDRPADKTIVIIGQSLEIETIFQTQEVFETFEKEVKSHFLNFSDITEDDYVKLIFSNMNDLPDYIFEKSDYVLIVALNTDGVNYHEVSESINSQNRILSEVFNKFYSEKSNSNRIISNQVLLDTDIESNPDKELKKFLSEVHVSTIVCDKREYLRTAPIYIPNKTK